jgi:mannose-6-phosphate isomerase-like protein (cupin superfamily)
MTETEQPIAAKPYTLSRDAGLSDVWFPLWEGRYLTKTGGEQTDGRLFQALLMEPRGAAPPLHIHHDADETWYVLEGQLTIFVGDREFEAGPGDFVLGSRGLPHSFLVRSGRAEFLVTFAPASATEGFFAEIGIPVVTGQPHPGALPNDPDDFARRAERYAIEIVGPPPTLD